MVDDASGICGRRLCSRVYPVYLEAGCKAYVCIMYRRLLKVYWLEPLLGATELWRDLYLPRLSFSYLEYSSLDPAVARIPSHGTWFRDVPCPSKKVFERY
jgi:hypothetical protein